MTTVCSEPGWAALVPELACHDLAASLAFYERLIGATRRFDRPGFAYLDIGEAQLMLEQAPSGWETGPLDPPLGRGINLQIEVRDLGTIAMRLADAGVAPFRSIADHWYRAGRVEHGQRELLVQDPDGYLLRFVMPIGERPA